ncbi:MAG: ABC transporter substrate-binding protein [Butyricicoccus sp.]
MRKSKKLLAAALAGVMALSMTACGGSSSAPASSGSGSADDPDAGKPVAEGSYNIGICQLVQHPALDAATKGFRDKLTELIEADGATVEFDEQNASGESANCSTIINGFVSNSVDLIMANATPALQAAQAGTADIPILGTSVTDYATALDISDWNGTTGTNIAGTTDLAPLDGQADMLNELFPDAKNVGLLYCSAEPNSAYQVGVIKPLLEAMGYTCTEYAFTDSNDVASVTQSAASASDVIYIPTDNTAASCTEAIANVVLPEKVPVIAGEQGICSGCGVATLSIDYYDLGVITGQLAYDILVKGAEPGSMEIQPAPNFTKMYNEANCAALGVEIPDGYEAITE